MKHLSKYKDFTINEGWLSDRLSKSSEGVKNSLTEFTKPFDEIVKKVKGDWQEEFKADEVRNDLLKVIGKSFDNLIKSIDKMNNADDVETIYDEIDQSLVQFNDSISKEIDNLAIKESIKSYKNYFNINEAQESVMAGLKAAIDSVIQKSKDLFNSNREDFLKIFEDDPKAKEEKGLDSKKEEAKEFFKKLSKDTENGIKELDIKSIVADAKAKIETKKSTSTEEYQPGTLLKYTKKDGDENTAEVANNQENVEDGFLNMISQDGKETFFINQDSIIGVADEDGDVEVTPEDITNSLEDIKGDKKAMNKLKNYIENELL